MYAPTKWWINSLASNQFSSSHATHLNMVELNNVFSMQSQQLKNFNLSLQIHLNFGVLLKIFFSYHLDSHLHCTSLCATCKSLKFYTILWHGINFILKDTYRVPSQQHFPKWAFSDSTVQVPYIPLTVGKLLRACTLKLVQLRTFILHPSRPVRNHG